MEPKTVTVKLIPLETTHSMYVVVANGKTEEFLPAANVEAIHNATKKKYAAPTSDNGDCLLPDLPNGEYVLTVTKEGFQPFTTTIVIE